MRGLVSMFVVFAACSLLMSCATTKQHVKTMDGDEFDQWGGALFSKQQYVQGLDADFYPNNSGAHIAVKGQGDQDSTEALKTINALIGALVQLQSAGLAAKPPATPAAPQEHPLLDALGERLIPARP